MEFYFSWKSLLSYGKVIEIKNEACVHIFNLSSLVFTPRPSIFVPFELRRRRLCRRRTQSFGYYTNMMQQIEFIIHTDIQPFPAIFLPKVKVIGQRSRAKIQKKFLLM